MNLVPKRKLITGLDGRPVSNILIQHITQVVLDEMETGIGDIVNRLWVRYRLRIPVGTDMYD